MVAMVPILGNEIKVYTWRETSHLSQGKLFNKDYTLLILFQDK